MALSSLYAYCLQEFKTQKTLKPFQVFLSLDNKFNFFTFTALIPAMVVSCSSGALFPLDLQDKDDTMYI